MSDGRRAWAASVAAVVAYTAVMLIPAFRRLYYDPELGAWGWGTPPSRPVVLWYGAVLASAVAALAGMALVSMLRSRPPWVIVWSAATVAMILLVWHERGWFAR